MAYHKIGYRFLLLSLFVQLPGAFYSPLVLELEERSGSSFDLCDGPPYTRSITMCAPHRRPYCFQCVFADGAEDTRVMHRPVSTTQLELPTAAFHRSPLQQTLMVCATFNVSVFLVVQLGEAGFYYVLLTHTQAATGCCPSRQTISHLIYLTPSCPMQCMHVVENVCKFLSLLFPMHGDYIGFQFS